MTGHTDFALFQYAGVAQLVERCLAKAKVAGSNPVFRSIFKLQRQAGGQKVAASIPCMVP